MLPVLLVLVLPVLLVTVLSGGLLQGYEVLCGTMPADAAIEKELGGAAIGAARVPLKREGARGPLRLRQVELLHSQSS